MNGRRAGKSPLADPLGNQFFDLNTLPTSAVRRMDIQTDGASAIYGSEAVAGVVNVVTKLGFDGLEVDAKADFAVNSSQAFNLAAGQASDKGALAVYLTHYRSDITYNTDFDFIVSRLIDANRDGLSDTTATGAPANSLFLSTTGAPDEWRNFATGVVTGTAVVDPNCAGAGGYVVGTQCLYDFAEQSSPIAAEDRWIGFAEFRRDLPEGFLGAAKAGVYGELGIARNRANRAAGPQATANGPTAGRYTIPANHPFNYFVANGTGLRWAPECFDATPGNDGGPCVSVPVSTQDGFRPLGQSQSGRNAPEESVYTNDAQRILVGLTAQYGGWDIDVWAQRYNHKATRTEPGNYIAARLQGALNNGTLNPFGSAEATPGAVSLRNPAVRAANSYQDLRAAGVIDTELESREASQTTIDVLAGNAEVFTLPGGPAGFAIGFQRREETFRFDPDPVLGNGLGSDRRPGAPDPTIVGETSVNSAFAELLLPVLETLELQAAVRYEDHGAVVGTTVDPKLAVRWDILETVALRASLGSSFQAPSPNQQGGIVGTGAVT
jgi:iron complex outermembrane recepter protein